MFIVIKLIIDYLVLYLYYVCYDVFCFVEMFVVLYEYVNDFC